MPRWKAHSIWGGRHAPPRPPASSSCRRTSSLFARARAAGPDGVVSGAASAIPELMLALDRAILASAPECTTRLEARLQEFLEWTDRFPVPVGVKAAMETRGLPVGPPSLPLAPLNKALLHDFKEWFRGWLPVVLREAADA